MDQKNPPGTFSREILPTGIITGIVGGIGMALLAMMISKVMGTGLLFPVDLIGATIFGVDAILGGMNVLVAGLIIHLATSIIFGVIFASIIKRETSALAAFWGGMVYGGLICVLMTYAVLPFVNPVMSTRIPFMAEAYFVEHLVYGGLLLFAPNLRRRFARKQTEVEQPLRRVA